jgi:hypothetical protein
VAKRVPRQELLRSWRLVRDEHPRGHAPRKDERYEKRRGSREHLRLEVSVKAGQWNVMELESLEPSFSDRNAA